MIINGTFNIDNYLFCDITYNMTRVVCVRIESEQQQR